jgi:hypothetical protein
MAQWRFSEIRPGDKTREPIQGEFFTSDSIGRFGEALIREGIQNALDAAHQGKPVRVRIFVSGPNFGVPDDALGEYFDGLWEHLNANGNGLSDPPKSTDVCPFILFEDFGTIGLQGDVEQYFPVEGKRNPFYHFVRAEGRSDKGEHERGRWGVGKFVFPRSSRANTVMCATVRSDDNRKLLIGQSVLKTHNVGDKVYTPDGFFGEPCKNGLTLPIENDEEFDKFCRIFNLDRTDKPGLSLVIPWHDPDINAHALVEATAMAYFYPILTGRLSVVIETPEGKTVLSKETLETVVESFDPVDAEALRPFLRIARFACGADAVIKLSPPNQKNAVKWSEDMIPSDLKDTINKILNSGEIVGLRVPLKVRRKKADDKESHFDVFLSRDDTQATSRPVFVREGIIISDVQARRSRGVRSLVIIEDGPLATLLGDAENPSHTRWENGSNFKNKYVYGTAFITFVTNATTEILAILSESDQQVDRTLLSDFFYLPGDEEDADSKSKSSTSGTKVGKKSKRKKLPAIPRNPTRFRISKQEGGFQLSGVNGTTPPPQIDIKVAYDVRRGSALRNYDKSDFRIGKNGVKLIDLVGVTVLSAAENLLSLQIDDPDFRCTLSGFDVERDLYVDARAKENANDD